MKMRMKSLFYLRKHALHLNNRKKAITSQYQ